MIKTELIIDELRTLAGQLNDMADDIESEEKRIREREESTELPGHWSLPWGGMSNWLFIGHKFENLFEGATDMAYPEMSKMKAQEGPK